MAGDTSALARPGRGPRDRGPARRATTCCGSRSRWPARTCAGWPRCARRRPGIRIAGGEMTRTFAEPLAALDADAFDVHQPDVVLAAGMLRGRGRWPSWRSPATAGSRRTPGRTASACWPTSHVAAGVGGGPFIEFPYDPPGWTAERRDFMLAEPVRPGRATASSTSRRRRASGSSSTTARHRGGTRHDRHGPARPPRTGWRAPPPSSRGPSCSSTAGSCRPPRADVRRHRRPRRRRGSPRSPRAARRTSTAPSPRPAGRSTTGAGRTSRRRRARRSCSRLAELIREHLDELALLESLDVGKPIRDTLGVDVPVCATTLQWYAETIDKTYGEVGPTGPDALSLVTREPIGVVGRDRALELPADHHRLEARARRSRPATRWCSSPPASRR